jgi:glycosyltransferase involved in cell wall biosynthesis
MDSKRLALLLPDMGGGGAERVALTLIKHFIANGYEVDLLLMRAGGDLLRSVPPQVRIIDLGAERIRDAIVPVAKYLAKVRPAAMQISMWPLTVGGIIAKLLSRSATRILVSDHAALSRQYANWGWWHRRLLRWSIWLFYPLADVRVVVAFATAKELSCLSGLPTTKFEVIYNPVEAPKDGPTHLNLAGVWGDARVRILSVGRLTPEKNHNLLLEAFASLPFSRDARLIILGEGILREELERRAKKLAINDLVAFPGFVPDPSPYYRSANLFVLSSDFEGYPLVLIEAMHCGLTIVSTACATGPEEILNGGEFGYLARCGDRSSLVNAIGAALNKPVSQAKLKRRAETLSADAADRYLSLMITPL